MIFLITLYKDIGLKYYDIHFSLIIREERFTQNNYYGLFIHTFEINQNLFNFLTVGMWF